MPKYAVTWSKTYYASGSVEIDANSNEEAEQIVRERMGDYEGSSQYDPDRDFVESSLRISDPHYDYLEMGAD